LLLSAVIVGGFASPALAQLDDDRSNCSLDANVQDQLGEYDLWAYGGAVVFALLALALAHLRVFRRVRWLTWLGGHFWPVVAGVAATVLWPVAMSRYGEAGFLQLYCVRGAIEGGMGAHLPMFLGAFLLAYVVFLLIVWLFQRR